MPQTPTPLIRDMRPGEEKDLLRAARRAFLHSPIEALCVSRPKSALVVEVDGAIAGAMFLRTYDIGAKRMGYLDVGFVVKEYRGHGIGRMLYPAAVEHLRAMGCDPIAAMVIDDNVASWKSLANQGFGTPTLLELVRALGLGGALSIWLRTMLCFASGTWLWMSGSVRPRSTLQELLAFLLVNLLLFTPRLLQNATQPERLVGLLIAFPAVLLAGVAFGGIGCLAAGGSWRFAFPRGGVATTLGLNALGSVFPMVGRWYPEDPQPTRACRRALGVQASVEWAAMLALFALGAYALPGNAFLHACSTLAANMLVYRMIPFMPFGAFGGARVWAWSRIAFVALAAGTLALLLLLLR